MWSGANMRYFMDQVRSMAASLLMRGDGGSVLSLDGDWKIDGA
jgi:hypothetical protein